MKKPTVLVLGATGFVGHTVYAHLKKNFQTFGTSRKANTGLFPFRAEHCIDDFTQIYQEVKDISLLINCIGSYKNASKEELITINALYPHQLEKLSRTYNFNLLHISTDAVFGALQARVTEDSLPYPDSAYGMTKLLGETDIKSAITIRTSFLGMDAQNHKGLIETALYANTLEGYENQLWSGCTTLQFAKLCQLLVDPALFRKWRKTSPFFHFSPLKPKTKYAILKLILLLQNNPKKIKKTVADEITRTLQTQFSQSSSFDQTYEQALQELFADCNSEPFLK